MRKAPSDPDLLPFRKERILSAGLLALLAPIPLAFTNSVLIQWFLLYLVCLGLHLAFVRSGRILCLPNYALNLAGFGFLFLLYADVRFGSRSLIRTTVHVLLFTCFFKFASVKRERDFSTLLILIAFLFVGSVATSFHVAILPFVFVFALVAWPIFVRWALWRDLAAVPEEWTRDPRSKELPGWRSALLSVSSILIVAIPFFLVLPRIKQPYVRGVVGSQEVWTGFSETVDPGVTGRLKQSDRVYMRVETNAKVGPLAPEVLRFRALAFSAWDGRTWTAYRGPARPLGEAASSFVPLVRPDLVRPDTRFLMTIDLTPLNSRFFPLPPHAVAVKVASGSVRNTGNGWIERDGLRNFRFPVEPQQTVQYQVQHGGPAVLDQIGPQEDDPSRKAPGSERIAGWAREVGGTTDPVKEPRRFALKIETFLATKFKYSLNIPMSGEKPVEEFLFDRKEGHCEAFATAMALAVREAGLPSRFVTGFLGGESGLFGRYFLVRGRSAHAWVEVWCGPQEGWVTFDPTPASGRPLFENVPWTRQVSNAADSVVFFYDRYILSFGQSDQADLIQTARERVARAAESVEKGASWVKAHRRVLKGVAAAFLLIPVIVWFVLRGLGLQIPGFGGDSDSQPGRWAYQKLQKRLKRMGARVTPASAPGQTLEETVRFGPEALAAASAIVQTYLAESFGGVRFGKEERGRLEKELGEVRRRKEGT